MKLIKSILAFAAAVFLGSSVMAADEEATDQKMHLAYEEGHADSAVILNHYHNSDYATSTYTYANTLRTGETTGAQGVATEPTVNTSMTIPASPRNMNGVNGETTVRATAATCADNVNVYITRSKGNPKEAVTYNVSTRGKRVVYVGKTAEAVCYFQVSKTDTPATGETGSWSDPKVEGDLVTAVNVGDETLAHNTLAVTGLNVGWAQVVSAYRTTGGDAGYPEGVTYTLNFQVRDTPVVSGGNPDRKIEIGAKLSTADLSGVEMVDSYGNQVQGSFEWGDPDKTWSTRTTTIEQARFTATGDNAEFYDPVTVDVMIIVGEAKSALDGIFGDPIAPKDSTRELSDCRDWEWKTAKVVGDDLGGVTVTAAPAQSGDLPIVNVENATRGGKVMIWVEDDDKIRMYEGVVYQEKSYEVTGYKNSTKYVKFQSDVAGVWTAQSSDESVATVTVPSESASEIEAVITCKKARENAQLTIKNDYVIYKVDVNVDDEKPVETGKFNLAQGEKAVMSLYQINRSNPQEWNFRVNKTESGVTVNRTGAEGRKQQTLEVTFAPLRDDGSATVSIEQHNDNEAKNPWDPYTGNYITNAVAQPKRIMYLGETKDLYCLSSEAAAWTVKTADDGIVSVTAPEGAVADGYAKVTGEKVGTTTFTIGNTAETSSGSGFFKGVTYTINYEVRGMPMADGTLTGDAYLKPGVALSTIGVAGSMKDAKGKEVEGTFAWVDGTLTFDEEGTKTVDTIFTPENTSYDSVKVEVVIKVSLLTPVDVPTAVTGLVYNGNEQTGVVAAVGFTLTDNTATNAGDYTATATLEAGYCWKDGKTEQKTIEWSIGYAQATVKADDADKFVGTEDPEFEATVRGLFGGDKIDYEVARTNKSEVVGTYDLVVTGAARQGSYDITYMNGTFEIRAGKITVNGKGYDDISEAINKLKQDGGKAVCNDDIDWLEKGIKFSNGAVLEYDNQEYIFTVTGGMTVPKVKADETIIGNGTLIVDGTLTLNGDLYANDDGGANVDAKNVVLGDDVTVGETEGEETDEIAVLKFDEIDVNGHKLTLTVNGVVQSAEQLEIDAIFTEVEHFHVAEKAIAGGFEYTLEATEFYVKYYDGDEVVHSNKFTILNYVTDLHIWNGDRKGLELVGYTREDKVTPLDVSDAALRAYVKDEADKPGCDGEVKVFGTWKKLNITIHIKADEETIDEVWYDEVPVANDDLELPAETKKITLTLEADVGLTVPVFKVVRGNVTNVTTKVATYAIADGDTLEFFAEEAAETDPTVTDDDIKTALIDSIDDDEPETHEAAAKKVDDVVGTGATQVSARNLAAYIKKNGVQSFEIANCDYVAASVKLDTDDLITEETEVEIAELVKAEGDGLTFKVNIDGEKVDVEAIKDMVEVSSDLTDWAKNKLEVKAEFDDGKVTITPEKPTDKAFMRVKIPHDPEVE